MKLLTVLTALIALTAGAPSSDERIASGTPVTTAIPHLVSITVDDQHVCGGFIYNENWVITAASCVFDIVPSRVKVIVAQVSLIQPDVDELTLAVFKTIPYEEYDPATKLHNIAMLQMAEPIVFGTNVNFIRYDEAEEMASVPGTFAGWGGTIQDGLPSTKLRKITMTYPATCGTYTATEYFPNYMLCFGDSAVDTGSPCNYDEGSPLVQTIGTADYAVGIMSSNKGCTAPAEPTLFTRLTAYYAWFNKNGGLQPVLAQ